MEPTWIVLLEATCEPSGSPITPDALRDLMEAMACDQIVGLHNPYRYAVQLRLAATSPAGALFSAMARWQAAVRQLGLEQWNLQRSEVLTPEEFDRDCTVPDGTVPTAQAAEPAAAPGRGEGDDLLRSVFCDSLTGFPTLALFRDRTRVRLSQSAGGRQFLLMVDLDRFGAINRDLGYIYGDQVLLELAARLMSLADPGWPLARLAGDEFVMLVDEAPEAVAHRVLDALRAPVVVKGRPVGLSGSIGLAAVGSSADVEEDLARAGRAMCAAKEAGGDRYAWYDAEVSVDDRRLDLVTSFVPDRLADVVLLERAALAANECSSLEEAAAMVLPQTLAHTGWRAGHLWLVAAGGTQLAASGVWHVSGPDPMVAFRRHVEARTVGIDEGFCGRVLRSGRMAWTTELARDGTDQDRQAVRQAGLVAAVAFPVLVGTEVVAILEFFSNRPVSPDESLLDVMAAVGAQLGRIFERTRAASALAYSEERYRTLADSLPALIWAAGPDRQCTLLNQGWLDFTGRAADEELGRGWESQIHPDDRARCHQAWDAAHDRREPFDVEYRLRRADGEYRWLLDRGTPVFEAGVFAGFVGGCIDVTDRHRMQDELRDEELRFRALVENADVMIVVLAADGTLIDEYLPVSNMGYPPGDARGRLGFDYIHPDDVAAAGEAFARALASPGPIGPFELRVRHADGSWRWLRSEANNMLDDPLVQGVVVTSTDVTEHKKLQEQIEATQEALRHTEEQLRHVEERLRQRDERPRPAVTAAPTASTASVAEHRTWPMPARPNGLSR